MLGQKLIDVHLFRHVSASPRHRFEGDGDGVVSKLRYEAGHIWINATQYFADVPLAVWAFEVGAYQVCEKWLRERRRQRLTAVEIVRYQQVLSAVGGDAAVDEGDRRNRCHLVFSCRLLRTHQNRNS